MSQMLALTIVLAILYIGDIVATRTKAWIPSVFVCAVLFLIGYWTFFPKDIVSIAGIGPVVATMLMYLLITNMGTLLSLKELKNQWKAIVISLAGIVGIIAILFTIGALLFDLKTMIVAVPPLVGGVVAALVMSEGASAAGLEDLAVFAIVIYVIQGFAGYPITSIVLKREAKRLLKEHQQGNIQSVTQVEEDVEQASEQPKLFRKIPTKYNTEYFKFFRLALERAYS